MLQRTTPAPMDSQAAQGLREAQKRIGIQLRTEIPAPPAHPQLAQDMDDALAKRKHGVLIRQVFNDESMPIFDDFTKASPNYLATEEIEIIHNEKPYLAKIGDELRALKRGPVTHNDLGTGKEHAITHKTFVTIEAVKPDFFVGTDFSEESTLDAAFRVSTHFNKAVGVVHHVADFTKDNLFPKRNIQISDKNLNGPRLFTMYGNTMANTEGPSNELPLLNVDKTVRNIRRHMKRGDYLLLGLQGEQKEDTTYHHPLFRKFHEHFPHFLKKHLHPDANVNPEDFEFFVQWKPSVSNHLFGYRAKNDGFIQPIKGGATYKYKKGEVIMLTCNSWRFPQNFIDEVCRRNALVSRKIMTGGNKRMFIHALQAS